MKMNLKIKLLYFVIVLACYVSYEFAFSKTIFYMSQYQSQKKIISDYAENPEKISTLKEREKELDQYISKFDYSKLTYQNDLLKQLNESGNRYHLKITGFNEPLKDSINNKSSQYYAFSLEGNFNSILQTVNDIENKHYFGTIRHLTILKKTDYQTGRVYLTSDILLYK